MKQHYLTFLILLGSYLVPSSALAQTKSTFEDLLASPSLFWNGETASYGDFSTTLQDSIFLFENKFSRTDFGYGLYESWGGFAYSRMQNDTTPGFSNQYSAITAGGAFGSTNYGVLFTGAGKDTVKLTKDAKLDSIFVTNATYPYLSMLEGDMFAKKFGGETGDDADWFLLKIVGFRNGQVKDTVKFYLADFRDNNNDNDYIINEWAKVDLTVLDTVDMLEFSLSSSDVGEYGMNTPGYFCIDNFSGADFEELNFTSGDYWNGQSASYGQYSSTFTNGPAVFSNSFSFNDFGWGPSSSWSGFGYSSMRDDSTAGYSNQYSAYPAEGANGSHVYAICSNTSGSDTLILDAAQSISGTFVTNGTYGVKSMEEGDMFAKKFGGENGNDPDWFLLTAIGINGGENTDTVEFYLADFRSDNNDDDYIVKDWTWMDLSSLGEVDRIAFSLSSSDVGAYGMNTPAYFFLDDLNDQAPTVANPIADLTVDQDSPDVIINLANTFSDVDDADTAIIITVKSNSNTALVSTILEEKQLTLSFANEQNGEAILVLEATSNGRKTSDEIVVTVNEPNTIDIPNYASIRVYPNPTSGLINLELGENVHATLTVLNALGQEVYHAEQVENLHQFNLENQAAGVYLLRISVGEQIMVRQLQKF